MASFMGEIHSLMKDKGQEVKTNTENDAQTNPISAVDAESPAGRPPADKSIEDPHPTIESTSGKLSQSNSLVLKASVGIANPFQAL